MHNLYVIDFPNGKKYLGITDYRARRFAAYRATVEKRFQEAKGPSSLS